MLKPSAKTYLVGGAVRDQLLGREVKERDWVVVGSTPQQMLDAGYKQVGKDFPVFLHPQTAEEHALARTERKQGHGYKGFQVHAAADVTLEQDLERRDLTINAIAQDQNGQLIDPYGGLQDLEQRLLRHVSCAFAEDPVRILRIARFAARYHYLGFRIADDTLALMRRMVADGEVDHLVAERIWAETAKALSEEHPSVYFQALRDCGALARIFPEIDALFGVPQTAKYHPEIDAGIHTMMVVDQAARLSDRLDIRFAALVHDLGKALTPKHILPSHHGHENNGVEPIQALCKRLRVPNALRDLAVPCCRYHLHAHRVDELKPKTLLKVFDALDGWRRPERIEQFLSVCEADARGRLGFEEQTPPQHQRFRELFQAAQAVPQKTVIEDGYQGPAIREELQRRRQRAIAKMKADHS